MVLKSGDGLAWSFIRMELLTLSVEEVLNGNIEAAILVDRSVFEDVFSLSVEELLAVLVAKSSGVLLDTGRCELLFKRHLLKLHVMDTSCS